MIRRLQNRIAESRTALPVTLVYMAAFMVIQLLLGRDTWLQMALLAISSVLMAELNNANALIRIYSRMVSCSFIMMTTAANFLLSSTNIGWAQMGLIVFFIFLLHAYQDGRAAGWVFYAFAALSLASIPFVHVLYLVPVLWIILGTNILALSLRTFLASLLGLMVPYWFIGAYAIVFQHLDWLGAHFVALAHPGAVFDLSIINDHQALTFIFLLIIAALGSVHFLMFSYQDKIRTRMIYEMFITLSVCCLLLMLVFPALFNGFMALAIVVTAPLIGHFLALTHSRLSNIIFFVIIAAALLLTIYNLL
jgi:hypothetical protein